MTGTKDMDFMDENTLPDHLLNPDSPTRKNRQNKETNFFIQLEIMKLSIMINTSHHFIATQREKNDKILSESLKHAREIENFFKNLAALNENSNLKAHLSKSQLEHLKSILNKLDECIVKITDLIKNALEKVKQAEERVLYTTQQLNESFKKIESIFAKCRDIKNLSKFTHIEIDLKNLTGNDLGKIEIDGAGFQAIINETNKDFVSQHKERKIFNLKNSLLDKVYNHIEDGLIKADPIACSVDIHHPELDNAANKLIEAISDAANCNPTTEFESYSHKKVFKNDADSALTHVSKEYNMLNQQQTSAHGAKYLTTDMIGEQEADLTVLKQFTGSLDHILGDLIDANALTEEMLMDSMATSDASIEHCPSSPRR